MFALADGLGALATFISGAGPTILAVVRKEDADAFFARASEALKADQALAAFSLHRLDADNEGARVL